MFGYVTRSVLAGTFVMRHPSNSIIKCGYVVRGRKGGLGIGTGRGRVAGLRYGLGRPFAIIFSGMSGILRTGCLN